MKAEQTRAGGRHVARERGSEDVTVIELLIKLVQPKRDHAPMRDFLSPQSLLALASLFPGLAGGCNHVG